MKGPKLRLSDVNLMMQNGNSRCDWAITQGVDFLTRKSLSDMLHRNVECPYECLSDDGFMFEDEHVKGIHVFRDTEYDLLLICGVNPHVSGKNVFLTSNGNSFLYIMCDYSIVQDDGTLRHAATTKSAPHNMSFKENGLDMFRNAVFFNKMMRDRRSVMKEMKEVFESKQDALCKDLVNSIRNAKRIKSNRTDFQREFDIVKPFMTREKLMHVNEVLSEERTTRERKRDEKRRLEEMMRNVEGTEDLSVCQSTLDLSFTWLGTVNKNRLFRFHKAMAFKSWTFCEQVLTFWCEKGENTPIILKLFETCLTCESPSHADVVGYYKYWKYIMRMATFFTDCAVTFGPHKSWLARLKVALRCPLDEDEDYEFALETANHALVQRDSRMPALAARLRLKIVEKRGAGMECVKSFMNFCDAWHPRNLKSYEEREKCILTCCKVSPKITAETIRLSELYGDEMTLETKWVIAYMAPRRPRLIVEIATRILGDVQLPDHDQTLEWLHGPVGSRGVDEARAVIDKAILALSPFMTYYESEPSRVVHYGLDAFPVPPTPPKKPAGTSALTLEYPTPTFKRKARDFCYHSLNSKKRRVDEGSTSPGASTEDDSGMSIVENLDSMQIMSSADSSPCDASEGSASPRRHEDVAAHIPQMRPFEEIDTGESDASDTHASETHGSETHVTKQDAMYARLIDAKNMCDLLEAEVKRLDALQIIQRLGVTKRSLVQPYVAPSKNLVSLLKELDGSPPRLLDPEFEATDAKEYVEIAVKLSLTSERASEAYCRIVTHRLWSPRFDAGCFESVPQWGLK